MNFRYLMVALTTTACLTVADSASAIATYDAEAMSTFTLVSTGGMGISFETGPEVPTSSTTGVAVASIDADIQTPSGMFTLAPGESVMQTSAVSGSADAPAGFSEASVLNGVFVTLDNTAGLTDAVAEFTFEYTWSGVFTKTDALLEAASASPFFHLTGFAPSGSETLMIDDGGGAMPVADWLVHPVVGSPLGDAFLAGGAAGTEIVTAFVTVPAGSIDSFSVITDAFGAAVHISPVPEPMTAALGFIALGALGAGIQRRRAA